MDRFIITILCLSLLSSCSLLRYQAEYVEPNPRVDTRSRPIEQQEKRVYSFANGSIQFDNLFDMARLNDCQQLNDSTYHIFISPENEPINSSPWYAFRIVSSLKKDIWLEMSYKKVKHRYHPKISIDGSAWGELADDRIELMNGDSIALFHLSLHSDTTWVAGQEVVSSSQVNNWAKSKSHGENVRYSIIGKSLLKRPLPMLDIYSGKKKKKPIIVVLGRLHPPEVTGYYAMEAFVETLMESTELTDKFFEKYRVLVYPLVNPDGIDLGHWRHNAGGVDLNRDWGNYKQPEIRQIADHIVHTAKRSKNKVILGIDFHSTYKDIYYTNSVDNETLVLKDFKDHWLDRIENKIPGYIAREEESGTSPVATSKNWFYAQLQAVGITYEIGDDTPREFIKTKGKVSAQSMMELLIAQKN